MSESNYILRGVDQFYLAIPELFLFSSILLLITLKLFFFKNKVLKYINKFSFLKNFITLILVYFYPIKAGFYGLFFTDDF